MVAVDTNILVYAEGVGDVARSARATALLEAIPRKELVLPAQVLAELFRVLSRKARLAREEVLDRLARWETSALVAPTLPSTLSEALRLATEHRFQIFDALILTASAEAGARLLLSEDMQDGFVWRGVTIANPFGTTPHPLLADLLRG